MSAVIHFRSRTLVLAPYARKGPGVTSKGATLEKHMSFIQRELERIGDAIRHSDPVPRYDEL
jgi:hypothetical protein